MKLGSIIEGGDYGKYLQMAKQADDATAKQARITYEKGSAYIKKFEYKANTKHVFLIPLELVLPFNPLDLEDETYNETNPFVLIGCPSIAVTVIKGQMRNDEKFKKKILSIMRLRDESVLNLDTEGVKDMEEGRLWHKAFARVKYLVGWTQSLNDGTFPNPISIGCEPILNERGEVTGTKGVGYEYYLAESALLAAKKKLVTEEYEKESRSDEDLKAAIKGINDGRILGNPRLTAFLRFIDIQVRNQEGQVSGDFLDAWSEKHNIGAFDRYFKYSRKFDDTISPVIGSKTYDNEFDFLEIYFKIPEEDPADKSKRFRDVTCSTIASQASIFKPDSREAEDLREVREAVKEYMSDTSKWNDDNFKRSIRELKVKSDADLSACLKNSIAKYEGVMTSEFIQMNYGETLSKIDSGLVSDAVEKILDGDSVNIEVTEDDIKALPTEKGFDSPDEDDFGEEFSKLLDEENN